MNAKPYPGKSTTTIEHFGITPIMNNSQNENEESQLK
jgi:hypothetical protein